MFKNTGIEYITNSFLTKESDKRGMLMCKYTHKEKLNP